MYSTSTYTMLKRLCQNDSERTIRVIKNWHPEKWQKPARVKPIDLNKLSSAEMPCLPVEGKRAFIFINDVAIEFECTYLDKELVAFELDEPGDPASVAAAL